jgi:hypothetical protein
LTECLRTPHASRPPPRSALGDDVAVVHRYFQGAPPSLRQHFEILETFDAGDGNDGDAPAAAATT